MDIAFGSVATFLVTIEDMNEMRVLEAEKFPRLHSWFNNFKNAPVIKENFPAREKISAFLKSLREKMLASA